MYDHTKKYLLGPRSYPALDGNIAAIIEIEIDGPHT